MEEQITISKKEYDELVDASLTLQSLRDAGVDNWEGYGYAMELREGYDIDSSMPNGEIEGDD